MGIQALRVSVGRTWRFTAGGQVAVGMSPSGYKRRLNQLKSDAPSDDFGLPWPPYQSRLWQHMFSKEYTQTATEDLVAGLLPLRWTRRSTAVVAGMDGKIEVEAIVHPFAATTIVHLSAAPGAEMPVDLASAYEAVKNILRTPVAVPDRNGRSIPFVIADGAPLELIPTLPQNSVDGSRLTMTNAGTFTLLSTLHDEKGALVASALAREFSSTPIEADSARLISDDSWIAVRDNTIGASFLSTVPAIGRRAACAHHNYSVLTAYMQNLGSTLGGKLGTNADWYREKSAMMLNSLYRRQPLAPFASVHEARLSELWIRERDLVDALDSATYAQPKVPSLRPA